VHPKLSQQQVVGVLTDHLLRLGRCPHRLKSRATIWDAPFIADVNIEEFDFDKILDGAD